MRQVKAKENGTMWLTGRPSRSPCKPHIIIFLSIIRLYCVVISWKVVYFAVTPFCNCTRTPQ